MRSKKEFKERTSTTLQHVVEANKPAVKGNGFAPGHFVPLCRYHNRKLADQLSQLFEENGITVQVRSTRMYRYFSVSVEQFAWASSLAKQFALDYPDAGPKTISRDFDAAILIGLLTIVAAAVSAFVPVLSRFAAIFVMINGVSLAILAEWYHRINKEREISSITIREIMVLTAIAALNIAIWRLGL